MQYVKTVEVRQPSQPKREAPMEGLIVLKTHSEELVILNTQSEGLGREITRWCGSDKPKDNYRYHYKGPFNRYA